MKKIFCALLLIMLSSCGYYKFRNINLTKKSSSKELHKFINRNDSVPYVFLHNLDTVIIVKGPLGLSEEDSVFNFSHSQINNEKEALEFYKKVEYMNDGMGSSSGKLLPTDDNFLPQIHLYHSNINVSDSIIMISNEQISEIHLIKRKEDSDIRVFLLVFSIVVLPILLGVWIYNSIGGY